MSLIKKSLSFYIFFIFLGCTNQAYDFDYLFGLNEKSHSIIAVVPSTEKNIYTSFKVDNANIGDFDKQEVKKVANKFLLNNNKIKLLANKEKAVVVSNNKNPNIEYRYLDLSDSFVIFTQLYKILSIYSVQWQLDYSEQLKILKNILDFLSSQSIDIPLEVKNIIESDDFTFTKINKLKQIENSQSYINDLNLFM